MAKGTIDRYGNVEIKFNIQEEKLYVQNGTRHLLPCENCGEVLDVALNVVSVICERCFNAYPEGVPEIEPSAWANRER